MDDDGLLLAGGEGVQLTWMDAKVGGWVVTPRLGKPVEVQALWYNALCLMAHMVASSAMIGKRNIMMRDMRT
jgi:predicted glycogen debranching enzyme